ncbi:major facilitator superfamily domain-containing protein 6 [Caerostris extrusa]|uniref:Major facilitator superfamily domain-containing protein 6 n=1 Tax=Caerostris extrusa TaxID=172846 RepID=A0AAV4VX70_CAEEX|nr:major facilitator superfamily domain-containing protein 6 [Caerostris extrusa]
MAAMFLLCLANITRLELTKPCFAKNILKGVRTVFKSKKFLAFELANLMNGVGIGICWFYLMWFIKSIGGSDLLCGLTIAVQSFGGCIPFMFFSGWIIRKFGHLETVTFALLTYGIRFLYYSYLHDPWWILPMELTHGITYGLNYTTMASFGKLSSKPGTEATTQSILFSTHEGLGKPFELLFNFQWKL